MLTGSRALMKASRSTPLPEVEQLRPLYEDGVVPRQGQLIVIFGQPASGKSTFAQWYVNEMNVPTLYFSADMDAQDAITRLGAMRTGMLVTQVTKAMHDGGLEYIYSELEGSKIQWCFDSGPTLSDITDELDAYVELWDSYPRVIVIDNAMNVEGEMDDEHGGLRLVFKELHRLAHDTGIAVVVLHHAREEGDPRFPPSRAQLQGKVGQLPEIILGVALNGDVFRIATVKCRSGKQDPTGRNYLELTANAERASFTQFQQKYPTVMYGGQPQW